MRKQKLPLIAALSVVAGSLILSGCSNPTAAPSPSDTASGGTLTVSSANFTESEIIGNLYAEALKDAGFTVETKFNIGTREAYIPALSDGSIDVIPDYTGNLLLFLDKNADVSSPDSILSALPAALATKKLAMLTAASAEDKDAVVVTRATAEKWNLKTIEDLVPHNDEVIMAGPPEFKERAVGLPGLEKNYGFAPVKFEPISDGGGPATVKALLDGKVTAANIFTTSTEIPANDLVVLEDPKNNFPAQQVVPVAAEGKLDDKAVAAIDAISAKLSTEELIKLNGQVSGDAKVEPKQAAITWLTEQGLLGK
ncbi:ABC transporter substrate-binding protein [Paeniglutamicibacter psychrophenolicus]|uniref:ABC transporter substrate-binding protein n=1 Tax=Paeniglutamicibacter psychrophenolicus TaxID=257454 RepID=UPI002788FB9E|nr:ABC transporter substrate-binding protein [Paeniglutamicibacter psychrophenolicus]MDQ0093421.1 osmoprotectant transport system substrate-binding protein [Paeniglutamicibacter psychrophenolicus]